jgi:purine-nucleoside phosphorylase
MAFASDLLHPATADRSRAAAEAIVARAGSEAPALAVILGTGLGPLAEAAEDAIAIDYADLPGFPAGGVSGHSGRLVIGRTGGRRVAFLQGRVHYYETGDAAAMRVPLEALALAGAPILLATNSCGSLRPELEPAMPVALSDHINWLGRNPLIGDPSDARFVNLVDAYDPELRLRLRQSAERLGFVLREGVYAWYSGPSFETPAEIRMARQFGADLVGMSTVPEVILARRLDLKVAALGMVTNYGAGMSERETVSHEQTKAVAHQGAARMRGLVADFIAGLDRAGGDRP